MKLLSWFDVRRVVATKTQLGSWLPNGIARIDCFSGVLEIGIKDKSLSSQITACNILKDWFGDKFDGKSISLEIGDRLPVECVDDQNTPHNAFIHPHWQGRVYSQSSHPKDIDPSQAKVVAFHSFSGGVGKTLHLTAHLLAILEHAEERKHPVNILLIDADLSSPRISYWGDYKRTVSLISYLECYQAANRDNVLNYFSEKLKAHRKKWNGSNVHVLPAFSDDQQLLDKNVFPRHLSSNDGDWGYTDAIQALAKSVDADYVFMNLESGLSEVSAPILFDPSVHRFLVTSPEISSLRGTELVLKELGRSDPESLSIAPIAIVNMMTAEIDNAIIEDAITRLKKAYCDTKLSRLTVKITDYLSLHRSSEDRSNLRIVSGWREAMARLEDTSIKKSAQEWVASLNNESTRG